MRTLLRGGRLPLRTIMHTEPSKPSVNAMVILRMEVVKCGQRKGRRNHGTGSASKLEGEHQVCRHKPRG